MGDAQNSCACSSLGAFAVIGMGDSQGRDEQVFATLDIVVNHGGDQWWLYMSHCSICQTDWMIAQDERIHDNFYLRRLSITDAKHIIEQNLWPIEFLSLESVIKLGPDNEQVACFLNPDDLTDTVKELIEARSEITAAEVAYLLNLSDRVAARQMLRASKMSWAQLRPFA